MSRYLKTYLIVIAVISALGIGGIWAVNHFDAGPQLRVLILLLTMVAVAGYTRLFWMGRRDGD